MLSMSKIIRTKSWTGFESFDRDPALASSSRIVPSSLKNDRILINIPQSCKACIFLLLQGRDQLERTFWDAWRSFFGLSIRCLSFRRTTLQNSLWLPPSQIGNPLTCCLQSWFRRDPTRGTPSTDYKKNLIFWNSCMNHKPINVHACIIFFRSEFLYQPFAFVWFEDLQFVVRVASRGNIDAVKNGCVRFSSMQQHVRLLSQT